MVDMDKLAEYSVDPGDELNDEVVLGEKTGTLADKRAMERLGKEQIFKVGRPLLHGKGILTKPYCSAILALYQYLDLPSSS